MSLQFSLFTSAKLQLIHVSNCQNLSMIKHFMLGSRQRNERKESAHIFVMTRTIPVNWESDTHCVSSAHAVELWRFQFIDQNWKRSFLVLGICVAFAKGGQRLWPLDPNCTRGPNKVVFLPSGAKSVTCK